MTATSTTTTLATCPAGYYGTATCTECAVGYYCPGGFASQPLPCPVGNYCPAAGASAPVSCAAGTEQPLVAQSSCSPCGAGTYASGTGQTACLPCSAGGFCQTGASAQTPCAAGTEQPLVAQSSCSPCVAGTYASGSGQTACLPCSAGGFCPAGASAQTPCAAGTEQPLVAQSSCSPCIAGTYASGAGQTACQPCSAGGFCPTGASAQTPCAAGSANPAPGGQSASACLLCQAGRYEAATGASVCAQACPVGCVCAPGATAPCPVAVEWPIASGSGPGRAGGALGSGPHAVAALLSVTELVAEASTPTAGSLAIGVVGVGAAAQSSRAYVFVGRADQFSVVQSSDGSVLCAVPLPPGDATPFSVAPVVSPAGIVIAGTSQHIVAVSIIALTVSSCGSPPWGPIVRTLTLPGALNLVGDVLIVASAGVGGAGLLEGLWSFNGTLIWSYATPSPITSAPVVLADSGAVVFGVGGSLYAVNGITGSLLWGPIALPSATTLALSAGTGTLLFCFALPTALLYAVDPANGSPTPYNVPQAFNQAGGQAPFLSPACVAAPPPSPAGIPAPPCMLYMGIGDSVLALSYTPSTQPAIVQQWSTPIASASSTVALCAVGADGVLYATVTAANGASGSVVGILPSGELLFSVPAAGAPTLGCAVSSDASAVLFALPSSSSLFSLATVALPSAPSAASTYQLGAILGGVLCGAVLLALVVAYAAVPAFRASLQVSKLRRVRVRRVTLLPRDGVDSGGVGEYSSLNGGEDGDADECFE